MDKTGIAPQKCTTTICSFSLFLNPFTSWVPFERLVKNCPKFSKAIKHYRVSFHNLIKINLLFITGILLGSWWYEAGKYSIVGVPEMSCLCDVLYHQALLLPPYSIIYTLLFSQRLISCECKLYKNSDISTIPSLDEHNVFEILRRWDKSDGNIWK